MIFKKIVVNSDTSIEDDFITCASLSAENVLKVNRYKKDVVANLEDGATLEPFSIDIANKFMMDANDASLMYRLASEQTIDLNNIPEELNTENAFILSGYTSTSDIGLYNRDKETYINKETNEKTRTMYNHVVALAIYKRFKDEPVDQVIFHLQNNNDFFTSIEGIVDMGTTYERINKAGIKLTPTSGSTVVDGIVEVNVQLVGVLDNVNIAKAGIPVYLKTSCGKLSHQKVFTDANGSASFRIKAELLAIGDVMEIKAGFKYYSNLDSTQITVA